MFISNRLQFRQRIQKPDETVSEWLVDLVRLSGLAKFGDDCCDGCCDARLIDQLVAGVRSGDARKQLLALRSDATLQQVSI
jgi:hypothetical protein